MKERMVYVYAHWVPMNEAQKIGVLKSVSLRGKEVFSFEYDRTWLDSGFTHLLDPQLQYYSGPQYLNDDKPNFGMFLDSSPDRWGKLLMRRREAFFSRTEEKKEKKLTEYDFLLGVYDAHRMGAIRFKENEEGPFLNDNKAMAAPPWTSIRELEHASIRLEEDDFTHKDYLKWLMALIAPGSSLGGARPKASVVDPTGQLWIAKFPSRLDETDIGGWEWVVNQLALKAGINVAEGYCQKFFSKRHTYLTKRFDRIPSGGRIHFASAMTLLGYKDGDGHQEGVSYLQLAEFLMRHGGNTTNDLRELWSRIIFSICVKNTDDHLRNHGFTLSESGWNLSPAYDINPSPYGTGLSLNITEHDNVLDPEVAMSVAPYFRIRRDEAVRIVAKIKKAVNGWRKSAVNAGIPKSEQDRMASAFSIAQK